MTKKIIIKKYIAKLFALKYFYTLDKKYLNKRELMKIFNLKRRHKRNIKHWRKVFVRALSGYVKPKYIEEEINYQMFKHPFLQQANHFKIPIFFQHIKFYNPSRKLNMTRLFDKKKKLNDDELRKLEHFEELEKHEHSMNYESLEEKYQTAFGEYDSEVIQHLSEFF